MACHLFRRLFLEKLVAAHQAGRLSFFGDRAHLADTQSFAAYLAPLRKAEWVVYAKRPFGGPEAAPNSRDEPPAAAVDPSKPTCPCCGGRMTVIEVFARAATPRHSPTSPATVVRIDTS
jgi:hypothetical protein